MFRRKSLPMGTLFLVLIIAVALVGVGYALWFEVLTIEGTVYTGEVDVKFSAHAPVECVDIDWDMSDDCILESEMTGDLEFKPPAANCNVSWLRKDGTPDDDNGANLLEVTITGMYPSWHCLVNFDVTNLGNVPVHVLQPVPTTEIPEWVAFNWDEACYTEGFQLHEGETTGVCTIDIHFTNAQAPPENAGPLTFGFEIVAHQWNESYPPPPAVVRLPDSWDGIPDTEYKGFGARFRELNSPGNEQEVYLGRGDLGVAANRLMQDLVWGADQKVTFIHDAANDKLITEVDLGNDGSVDHTLEYPNLTAQVAALGSSCTVPNVDYMVLQVVQRQVGVTVQYNNVDLNGFALGNFDGGGVFANWGISGVDFSQDFTITGDFQITGPFDGSAELNKLEMLVACNP